MGLRPLIHLLRGDAYQQRAIIPALKLHEPNHALTIGIGTADTESFLALLPESLAVRHCTAFASGATLPLEHHSTLQILLKVAGGEDELEAGHETGLVHTKTERLTKHLTEHPVHITQTKPAHTGLHHPARLLMKPQQRRQLVVKNLVVFFFDF